MLHNGNRFWLDIKAEVTLLTVQWKLKFPLGIKSGMNLADCLCSIRNIMWPEDCKSRAYKTMF